MSEFFLFLNILAGGGFAFLLALLCLVWWAVDQHALDAAPALGWTIICSIVMFILGTWLYVFWDKPCEFDDQCNQSDIVIDLEA